MGKMDGRVAIVTGAAQGIGRAIAEKLADEGAQVVVLRPERRGGRARGVRAAGSRRHAGRRVVAGQVQRLVDETVSRFGKVDVLVNNAAIVPFTPWDDIDFAEWRRIMLVNLDGTFLTYRAVHDAMRDAGYGRIVNISSNAMLAGTPNLAHYVASKGGVFAFTRALARSSASTASRSTRWRRA